jgi:hypothetical protein
MGDTKGGSSLFRPFRARRVLETGYPGRCPGLSYRGLSGLGGGHPLLRAYGELDCEQRTSDIPAMDKGEFVPT